MILDYFINNLIAKRTMETAMGILSAWFFQLSCKDIHMGLHSGNHRQFQSLTPFARMAHKFCSLFAQLG